MLIIICLLCRDRLSRWILITRSSEHICQLQSLCINRQYLNISLHPLGDGATCRQVEGVQHEPVGDVDGYYEKAEFANWHDVDQVPNDGQSEDIGQGREQDLETTPTESKAYTFRYGVMERDCKYSFGLHPSVNATGEAGLSGTHQGRHVLDTNADNDHWQYPRWDG
jgi:hypothetical protein